LWCTSLSYHSMPLLQSALHGYDKALRCSSVIEDICLVPYDWGVDGRVFARYRVTVESRSSRANRACTFFLHVSDVNLVQ